MPPKARRGAVEAFGSCIPGGGMGAQELPSSDGEREGWPPMGTTVPKGAAAGEESSFAAIPVAASEGSTTLTMTKACEGAATLGTAWIVTSSGAPSVAWPIRTRVTCPSWGGGGGAMSLSAESPGELRLSASRN